MLDGAVRFLPWWQALLVRLAVGLLVMFGRRAGPLLWAYLRSIEPSETTMNPDGSHKEGTGAPPMPMDKDGSMPLDQKPPTDWS